MTKKKIIWFVVFLAIISLAVSYAHRFLVVNRQLEYSFPVITDTVIPATTPLTNLTKS